MPGLVRKLVITAAFDGLILQAHGPTEHHKSLHIDYKTRKIKPWAGSPDETVNGRPDLDSYGIIGVLSIASLSYLIAITRREQVAQIFGKPIYVITDVAVLPLSSQHEAKIAIAAAAAERVPPGLNSDESSDSDAETHHEPHTPLDPPDEASPTDKSYFEKRIASGTSIAEDVIARRGQYGRFASQWFSRKGWGLERTTPTSLGPAVAPKTSLKDEKASERRVAHSETKTDVEEHPASPEGVSAQKLTPKLGESALALLPKILRSTKLILSSKSFYFSYDINLTRRLSVSGLSGLNETKIEAYDPLYFWNRTLGALFFESGHTPFVIPLMQGFVGQRSFEVNRTKTGRSQSVVTAIDTDCNAPEHAASADKPLPATTEIEHSRAYLLTLISRRSIKRSGLRYLRRGIDDEGNVANEVETEQILSPPDWDASGTFRSFVQVRGSIPLYFSQTPYAFKPIPVLHQSAATNEIAFRRHFEGLRKRYGGIQIALLVDRHGGELSIGKAYEEAVQHANNAADVTSLRFEWFDFHAECRGMKFENVELLVDTLNDSLTSFGETIIENGKVIKSQVGIIRTNCMDCLDRTNVTQSAFGQKMLQRDLGEAGFEIDLLHDEKTTWVNELWADNGDAISRQYASTAALKGDFTRTRKRNYRGALNDLGLTLTRYYNNMFNDFFVQACIDVLLGNISPKVFEDFESSMMSADPGISIEKVREAAIETCSKIVIQDADEDLVHGWIMLNPAQPNTLRTLPFEEAVVLLTDAALYCCKFDWNTEKVASFEKVDLRSIQKIRFGTYITSVLTEPQMNEKMNVGLVVVYRPGQGNTMRVNTRSLLNSVQQEENTGIDGGTGILSWLGPRTASSSPSTMAFKVVVNAAEVGEGQEGKPLALAEHISDEIRRKVFAGSEITGSGDDKMMEQGDIISLAEAKKRTGYLEQASFMIKKLVWT